MSGTERRHSLQRRLQLSLMALLVVVFVALWGAATYTIHRLVEHYLITRLDHDAEMLAGHLRHDGRGWHLDWNAINPIYLRPGSGHYFVIETPGARIASPSLAGYPMLAPEAPASNPYETLAPAMAPDDGLEPVLVWQRTASIAGMPVRIHVAENHMPIQRYLYWFDTLFAVIALAVLLLVGWWSRRMLAQGFDSLARLQQAVETAARTGERLHVPDDLPVEVAPLAHTLQAALAQMQARLQRYRNANADLAHSLKTPLHAIFQLLDAPEMADCPQRSALLQQAEHLRARIDQVLRQARLAGGTLAVNRFDLAEALPQLVDTLSQLHRRCRISVSAPDGGQLPIEREDGFELLGNLLDNACKWARGQVRLTIERRSDGWRIVVEDDGPGVPDEKLDQLGQRGRRLDERSSENGIGLAIVTEIVRQYGGRIRFERSPLGGLGVTVELKEVGHATP